MLETEMEGPDLYERICRDGMARVFWRSLQKALPDLQHPVRAGRFLARMGLYGMNLQLHLFRWKRRGIPCLTGVVPGAFSLDVLSGMRSMAQFCLDLHRRPDQVLRALAVANRFQTEMALLGARMTGARYCFIGSSRASASFISPRVFELFALPLLRETTARLLKAGITPFLHFDSDWTPMLPYLRELPARKCILDLDGTTDIFQAKEILGDHMCLMGDVPAALLKLGTVEEVEAYCERLIREVGAGGGFILSSGCSTPPDAKPENVRAMVESVRKFRP
jgi:uroporphyrinogen-III decarboxylase